MGVKQTVNRLRSWGMTTAGPGSYYLLEEPAARTSFAEDIIVKGTFARIGDPSSGTAMPDVFDPAWPAAVTSSLTVPAARYGATPYNVGMFVDNELPWAKTYALSNARFGLCEDILLAPATQPAKVAFVNWLAQRYGNSISALNASWGTSFATFNAILTAQTSLPVTLPAGMSTDMNDFTLVFARQYFTTIKQTLSTLGYHGMYLGCRFLYYTPQTLQACQESCDLISVNDYELRPGDHHDDVRTLDAPVLISETGFSACDLGRVPAGINLVTENDRTSFFSRYLSDALGWTNLVGYHWYKWEDDVVSGRYSDGSFNSFGIVSIADVPYWHLIDVLTAANIAFQQKLLVP
jgi:hypothetical protein